MTSPVYLSALGMISPLGRNKSEIFENLMAGKRPGILVRSDLLVDGAEVHVGVAPDDFVAVPQNLACYASRNASLIITALDEIRSEIEAAKRSYGAARISVVMGTSTSGIAEGEEALRNHRLTGSLPSHFDLRQQDLGNVAEIVARYLGLTAPAISISTACSSGAIALATARRLLRAGLADAVIAGAADSLCKLTVNGFRALSALSSGICNPFSRRRDGTTIGEGAAIFLVEQRPSDVALLGVGCSADAYSMTAPEPEAVGVKMAMRAALDDARIDAGEIDYVQLHGTGTVQNDAMESKAVLDVFGSRVSCSSSKGQTGHALGAAGALSVAHCWLAASALNVDGSLPPHLWDGDAEDGLLSESLVSIGEGLSASSRRTFMSNVFAFGGSNACLVIGRGA